MASLVEELLVGMKKEDACYTRLLELSENKRQAIIAGAVADLEEVTATEESISSDLKNLENKRVSILRDTDGSQRRTCRRCHTFTDSKCTKQCTSPAGIRDG